MADQQGLDPKVPGLESTAGQSGLASTVAEGKGKDKQPIQDVSMGEEESDEDEDESGAEGAVRSFLVQFPTMLRSLIPFAGARAYDPLPMQVLEDPS